MKYLGALTKMLLKHDNTGPSPDWHLFKAVVTCSKDDDKTTFICNKWIKPEVCCVVLLVYLVVKSLRGDCEVCYLSMHEIYAISPITFTQVELVAGQAEPIITSYHIDVYTSSCKGAGTDAGVSIKLKGPEVRNDCVNGVLWVLVDHLRSPFMTVVSTH